jgi:cyclophilin family peptidyl-prolyl cis-trans isomerase
MYSRPGGKADDNANVITGAQCEGSLRAMSGSDERNSPSARRTAIATGAITLALLAVVGAVALFTGPNSSTVAIGSEAVPGTGLTLDTAPPTDSTTPLATEPVSTLSTSVTSAAPDSAAPESSLPVTLGSPTTLAATSTTAVPTTTASTTLVPTTVPATTVPASTTTTVALLSGQSPCPAVDGSSAPKKSFAAAPPMCIQKSATYRAVIETSEGTIKVLLDSQTPLTTNNFVYLSRYHFYDGLTFHRVVPDFVIQGGDPTGTGQGTPGYEFQDELPTVKSYPIGALAMANGRPANPNTNGSQFFITVGSLAAGMPVEYPLFGSVTDGRAVLKKIGALGPDPAADPTGKPSKMVTIKSITIKATGEK